MLRSGPILAIKMMTWAASALTGGDYIDAAAVLRTSGTASAVGCVVKAPSTLCSFRWDHIRQLGRVSRELLEPYPATHDLN